MNYDHPEAFETELLLEQLQKLRAGVAVDCPVYDYSMHNRSQNIVKVEPKKVILVEGILVFADERLRSMFDIKIFVEADADERILRRVIRDVKERGRDIEGVVEQYYSFVEPTKPMADVIINSGMNEVAFQLVKTNIEKILESGNQG